MKTRALSLLGTLGIFLAVGILFTQPARATSASEETHPDSATSVSKDGQQEDNGSHRYWRQSRLSVSISPRYYSLNTNGYASAFTNSALASPKSGAVGADFSVYWTTDSKWQIGFGFSFTGADNSNGSTDGQYSAGLFGLWLGREFAFTDEDSITLGGLFAFGQATLEVISTGNSGRTVESSFTLEPKIIYTHKVASWLKVGLSASYLEPLSPSQDIKGNQLTNGNISLHGFSAGAEFVIGRFGDATSASAKN